MPWSGTVMISDCVPLVPPGGGGWEGLRSEKKNGLIGCPPLPFVWGIPSWRAGAGEKERFVGRKEKVGRPSPPQFNPCHSHICLGDNPPPKMPTLGNRRTFLSDPRGDVGTLSGQMSFNHPVGAYLDPSLGARGDVLFIRAWAIPSPPPPQCRWPGPVSAQQAEGPTSRGAKFSQTAEGGPTTPLVYKAHLTAKKGGVSSQTGRG